MLSTFSGRLTATLLVLLVVLTGSQVVLFAHYSRLSALETSQILQRNLARQIALRISDFLEPKVDYAGLEEELRKIVELVPRSSIFLLDDAGRVQFHPGDPPGTLQRQIDLAPLHRFLSDGNRSFPIEGDDPREGGTKAVFSAAPVTYGGENGYLYVLLESRQFDSVSAAVQGSYAFSGSLLGFAVSILLAAGIGALAFRVLTNPIRVTGKVLASLEKGDFRERVPPFGDNELGQLSQSINSMADSLEQKIAELATTDQQRRQLVSHVSHDLRVPLQSILGHAERLLELPAVKENTRLEQGLRAIERSGEALSRQIRDLFELAKLEAKERTLEIRETRVSDFVEDLLLRHEPSAEEKGLTIHADAASDSGTMFVDRSLIERAVSNLVENAIRYTDAGGTIRVSCHRDRARNTLIIQVADTGIGIPKSEQQAVFEQFVRASNSEEANARGTGLGLAITKKVIEAHGGSIMLDSEPGKGSCFSIELPGDSSRTSG